VSALRVEQAGLTQLAQDVLQELERHPFGVRQLDRFHELAVGSRDRDHGS